jgi:hypothetical protein
MDVHLFELTWLDPKQYGRYRAVLLEGSFSRAKVVPGKYTADELEQVRTYLESGGTLLVTRPALEVFATPEGRAFLLGLTGKVAVKKAGPATVRLPDHPWVKHLGRGERAWLMGRGGEALSANRGEIVLGTATGAWLGRFPLGRGQLVYFGWSPTAARPDGRKRSTPEQEAVYEEQTGVVMRVLAGLR